MANSSAGGMMEGREMWARHCCFVTGGAGMLSAC